MDVLSNDTISWRMQSEEKTNVVRLEGLHAAASCSAPESLLGGSRSDSDPPTVTCSEDRERDETVRVSAFSDTSREKVLYRRVVQPGNERSGTGSSK